MDIEKLAAKHVQELVPYQSARRIGGHGHTFLNANESPKSELYFFNSTTLNRYPDCQPQEVVTAYADYANVRPENVLVSRGSDEAIGLIVRTFCEQHEEGIVIAPPTYGMYEVAANTNGALIAKAKRNDDFTLSVSAIEEAINNASFKVKAVFIDSPANPLGIIFNKDALIELLTKFPDTFIVMDEAYIEYAPKYTVVDLIKTYPNLIVLRTLSKAYALAGIRCGFAIADAAVIKLLTKVIDPYPIPDPVAQVARQALASGGKDLMKIRVALTLKRRDILESALLSLPIVKKVYPSEANFLLVQFADGPKIFNAVAQKGIILRSFDNKPGLKDCIRISIGSDEELDELMRTLSTITL